MGETTGIEWAQATWNPWQGCHKVSAGCAKCYMFREVEFYGRDPNVVVRSKTTFDAPLKWARGVKNAPPPGARIFTCSWSDWFIPEADEWRAEAWRIVEQTPQYTYLILTKRPERMFEHLPANWGAGYPNVWLGVSCENQEAADKRVKWLMTTPARVRFVSAEPLLGPIDFECIRWGTAYPLGQPPEPTYISAFESKYIFGPEADYDLEEIHWVITGGESDKENPRPCNLDWVRAIRNQCTRRNVSFFHKQHGGSRKVNGTWGGRELDGVTWHQFPWLKVNWP